MLFAHCMMFAMLIGAPALAMIMALCALFNDLY